MFIVNNQMLSKQETPEIWEWYSKKINKIKKGDKKYYVFSAFKFHRFEVDEYNKKRRMRRYKTVPSHSTFDNEEMGTTQTWTYVPSANAIRNENGLIRVLNQKPFTIGDSETFKASQDFEIIFFLLYVSRSLKSKKIYLIDLEADNIKKANEASVAAEAQYLIFSPQSAINEEQLGTDEVFRQLGIAYGVKDAYTIHLAELKNKLWNGLVEMNKNRRHAKISYEQFIKDCYNNTDSELKATILMAVERGIIYFDKGGWWIKIRGEYDELVIRVPQNEDSNKKDILVNYLMQHREYMNIIKEAIENTAKRLIEVDRKPADYSDDVEKMPRPQMIKILSTAGFKPKDYFSKTNIEMREMVKENLRPIT